MTVIHTPKASAADASTSTGLPPNRRIGPTEVLFPEAKQRERRRRLAIGLAVVLVGIVVVATLYGTSGSGQRPTTHALHHVNGGSPLTVADGNALNGRGNLAFVSLGALFLIDGATGKTVAVTGINANATDPSFSPNGKWLIYETGNDAKSWLVRSNGIGRRQLSGLAAWGTNGELVVSGSSSNSTYLIGSNGALHRTGTSSEQSNVVSVAGKTTYMYTVDTMKVVQRNPAHGVEEIETASTANGPRTLWYSAKVSFTPNGGLQGTFPIPVAMLPDGRGLLLKINPYCCDYADGEPLYEIIKPGDQPHLLGTVLSDDDITYGPNDTFALSGGGNRYAWVNKYVELCNEMTATCSRVSVPKGMLTVSPSWAPNGKTLAYVEAKAGDEGSIGQAQIRQWYATHHLYLLSVGSKVSTEVSGTEGAMAPVWSSDSKSLMFVRNDDLFPCWE